MITLNISYIFINLLSVKDNFLSGIFILLAPRALAVSIATLSRYCIVPSSADNKPGPENNNVMNGDKRIRTFS